MLNLLPKLYLVVTFKWRVDWCLLTLKWLLCFEVHPRSEVMNYIVIRKGHGLPHRVTHRLTHRVTHRLTHRLTYCLTPGLVH